MNLSVLDQNILYSFIGLECPGEAERVYLTKRDREPPLAAEQAALRWERACRSIVSSVRAAEKKHDGQDHGVLDFIRTRFLNMSEASL